MSSTLAASSLSLFNRHVCCGCTLWSRDLHLTRLPPLNQITDVVEQKENKTIMIPPSTSRRTGVIAIKLGMSHIWTKTCYRVPVTLLQILDNTVVRVKTKDSDRYTALQMGAVDHPKPHKLNKSTLGHFNKYQVAPKRMLQEFRVTEDAILPVGTDVGSGHFVAGQYVDVCGTTIGKGFQGVMKRHGMKGQPASHGVTKTHRKMGATGGGGVSPMGGLCRYHIVRIPDEYGPGRRCREEWEGKERQLKAYWINHRFNVLYVKGCVPGHKNNYVRVTDAKRKPMKSTPLPFPTHFEDDSAPLPEETYWEHLHQPHLPTLEFANLTSKN